MQLLSSVGYLSIFLLVGLESVGIPLPGETALITAAVYAGTTHKLVIWYVILVATLGAIVGDNIGYWIGREGGFFLLKKYGKYIRIDENKLKLGQYLFRKYGGRVVFFGRFFSLLRIFAAFLAGVNDMPWNRFLLFNALGALCWSFIYGMGAYILGERIQTFNIVLKIVTLGIGVIIFLGVTLFIKHNEKRLEKEALKEMPEAIERYRK